MAIKVILSLVVIIYSSAFSDSSIKGNLSEVVLVCILSVLI